MNSNKISLIIVLLSFLIAGGFVVAAKLQNRSDTEEDVSASSVTEESTSSYAESEPESSIASSEEESSLESSSQEEKNDNSLPRDENGVELPYDVMPMVNAYNTGDISSLSQKDKETLEAAAQVIDEIITEDMSDYDKTLAIHDYIILNNEYNDNILNIFGVSSLDDSTPYGMLIKHTTVCKGYATTFKLLCNMCGIECELIIEYEGKDIEHAYNRMNLGGYWYYTDVTWDDKGYTDFMTIQKDYRYFSLTKDQLAYNHDLDDSCPDTESDIYTFAAQNNINIKSEEEYINIIEKATSQEIPFPLYLTFDESMGIDLIFHDESIGIDDRFEQSENIDRLQEAEKNVSSRLYMDYSKVRINGEVLLMVTTI